MFKEIVDDARCTTDIGRSQKLTFEHFVLRWDKNSWANEQLIVKQKSLKNIENNVILSSPPSWFA